MRLNIPYFKNNSTPYGMKQHRVALVEDNPDDQQTLIEFVDRTNFLVLLESFDTAMGAMPFLTKQPVDLLLLDLHLPGLSGFDLLRSLPNPPAVILTTSSLSDSLEAFDVGVVDYLVKPIRYERFLRAVNRVLARQPATVAPPVVVRPTLLLKQGRDSVAVLPDDILVLEASGANSVVHLSGNRSLTVSHLLTDLLEQLPPTQFVRVHRAFAVALPRISTISNRQITLDTRLVPIGRAYHDDVFRLLNDPKKGG